MRYLTARADSDAFWIDDSLLDLLPNRSVVMEDGSRTPILEALAFGTITEVSPGASYAIIGNDKVTDVPFEDPSASWSIAVLTLNVDESLGSIAVGESIDIALPFYPEQSFEDISRDLKSIPRAVVAVHDDGGRMFEGAFAIYRDSTLLGFEEDGRVTFPALADEEDEYLKDASSVDELREAAAGPEEIVRWSE